MKKNKAQPSFLKRLYQEWRDECIMTRILYVFAFIVTIPCVTLVLLLFVIIVGAIIQNI